MEFKIVLGRMGSDIWANSRLRAIKDIAKEGSILDLGCGSGYIGESFDSAVFAEMDINELKKVKGNKRVVLNAEELSFKKESFDYVICGDVLEHIKNDDVVLKEINRILKKNGKAVITVPAYRRLYGHHDVIMGHKRRYNKKDFLNLAKSLGFKVVKSRYVCSLLFFPFIFNQLFSKSAKAYHGKSKIEKRIIGLLNFISWLENKINLPFGVGLLFVLRK